MQYDRIEMVLEVKGEVRTIAYPLRNHESIERQRRQWYYFYGLKSVKEWDIYITQKSEMKECKPPKISKEFPYFKKYKSQQNESTESKPISLYCEPVNLAGGLIKVVGKRQSQVL